MRFVLRTRSVRPSAGWVLDPGEERSADLGPAPRASRCRRGTGPHTHVGTSGMLCSRDIRGAPGVGRDGVCRVRGFLEGPGFHQKEGSMMGQARKQGRVCVFRNRLRLGTAETVGVGATRRPGGTGRQLPTLRALLTILEGHLLGWLGWFSVLVQLRTRPGCPGRTLS